MYSRWFSATVVILWLATMGWLVEEKVLPLMLVGEPPSVGKVIESQRRKPVVGWHISFGDRSLGWALTETKLLSSGLTEIRGRVRFDSLPVEALSHGWLQPLSRLVGKSMDKLQLDTRSLLTVESLGHLVHFDCVVRLDPWDEVFTAHGIVEGSRMRLQLRVRSNGFEQTIPEQLLPLPTNALVSDVFSPQPQTEMPGLRLGQTWTVPIYSPFSPDKNRLEILRATVEESQRIPWNGDFTQTWLVVYRSESEGTAGGKAKVRGRVWIRRDGAVLKQEMQIPIIGSTISFERMSDNEAAAKAKAAGRHWWTPPENAWMGRHD